MGCITSKSTEVEEVSYHEENGRGKIRRRRSTNATATSSNASQSQRGGGRSSVAGNNNSAPSTVDFSTLPIELQESSPDYATQQQQQQQVDTTITSGDGTGGTGAEESPTQQKRSARKMKERRSGKSSRRRMVATTAEGTEKDEGQKGAALGEGSAEMVAEEEDADSTRKRRGKSNRKGKPSHGAATTTTCISETPQLEGTMEKSGSARAAAVGSDNTTSSTSRSSPSRVGVVSAESPRPPASPQTGKFSRQSSSAFGSSSRHSSPEALEGEEEGQEGGRAAAVRNAGTTTLKRLTSKDSCRSENEARMTSPEEERESRVVVGSRATRTSSRPQIVARSTIGRDEDETENSGAFRVREWSMEDALSTPDTPGRARKVSFLDTGGASLSDSTPKAILKGQAPPTLLQEREGSFKESESANNSSPNSFRVTPRESALPQPPSRGGAGVGISSRTNSATQGASGERQRNSQASSNSLSDRLPSPPKDTHNSESSVLPPVLAMASSQRKSTATSLTGIDAGGDGSPAKQQQQHSSSSGKAMGTVSPPQLVETDDEDEEKGTTAILMAGYDLAPRGGGGGSTGTKGLQRFESITKKASTSTSVTGSNGALVEIGPSKNTSTTITGGDTSVMEVDATREPSPSSCAVFDSTVLDSHKSHQQTQSTEKSIGTSSSVHTHSVVEHAGYTNPLLPRSTAVAVAAGGDTPLGKHSSPAPLQRFSIPNDKPQSAAAAVSPESRNESDPLKRRSSLGRSPNGKDDYTELLDEASPVNRQVTEPLAPGSKEGSPEIKPQPINSNAKGYTFSPQPPPRSSGSKSPFATDGRSRSTELNCSPPNDTGEENGGAPFNRKNTGTYGKFELPPSAGIHANKTSVNEKTKGERLAMGAGTAPPETYTSSSGVVVQRHESAPPPQPQDMPSVQFDSVLLPAPEDSSCDPQQELTNQLQNASPKNAAQVQSLANRRSIAEGNNEGEKKGMNVSRPIDLSSNDDTSNVPGVLRRRQRSPVVVHLQPPPPQAPQQQQGEEPGCKEDNNTSGFALMGFPVMISASESAEKGRVAVGGGEANALQSTRSGVVGMTTGTGANTTDGGATGSSIPREAEFDNPLGHSIGGEGLGSRQVDSIERSSSTTPKQDGGTPLPLGESRGKNSFTFTRVRDGSMARAKQPVLSSGVTAGQNNTPQAGTAAGTIGERKEEKSPSPQPPQNPPPIERSPPVRPTIHRSVSRELNVSVGNVPHSPASNTNSSTNNNTKTSNNTFALSLNTAEVNALINSQKDAAANNSNNKKLGLASPPPEGDAPKNDTNNTKGITTIGFSQLARSGAGSVVGRNQRLGHANTISTFSSNLLREVAEGLAPQGVGGEVGGAHSTHFPQRVHPRHVKDSKIRTWLDIAWRGALLIRRRTAPFKTPLPLEDPQSLAGKLKAPPDASLGPSSGPSTPQPAAAAAAATGNNSKGPHQLQGFLSRAMSGSTSLGMDPSVALAQSGSGAMDGMNNNHSNTMQGLILQNSLPTDANNRGSKPPPISTTLERNMSGPLPTVVMSPATAAVRQHALGNPVSPHREAISARALHEQNRRSFNAGNGPTSPLIAHPSFEQQRQQQQQQQRETDPKASPSPALARIKVSNPNSVTAARQFTSHEVSGRSHHHSPSGGGPLQDDPTAEVSQQHAKRLSRADNIAMGLLGYDDLPPPTQQQAPYPHPTLARTASSAQTPRSSGTAGFYQQQSHGQSMTPQGYTTHHDEQQQQTTSDSEHQQHSRAVSASRPHSSSHQQPQQKMTEAPRSNEEEQGCEEEEEEDRQKGEMSSMSRTTEGGGTNPYDDGSLRVACASTNCSRFDRSLSLSTSRQQFD